MTGEPFKSLDPDLLLEASRVMNAAGAEYANATRLISDWAMQNLAKAAPPTRAAILGDAAALRLRTPGHYEEALEKLQQIDTPDCPDPDGRLHMLRALANGQRYTDLKRKNEKAQKPEDKTPDTTFTRLGQSIREDLAVVFKRDKTAKRANAGYWKPFDTQTPDTEKSDVVEDDLRHVYDADEDFRTLVDSPDEGPRAPGPPGEGPPAPGPSGEGPPAPGPSGEGPPAPGPSGEGFRAPGPPARPD